MSFQFNWVFPDPQSLYARAKVILNEAVNKKPMPPIMADRISVETLDFGTIAPILDIVEISDIGPDRFKATLNIQYNGNFKMSLKTQIQANLLTLLEQTSPSKFAMPVMVGAASSLLLPLRLELSKIQLSGTITVVYSMKKGLTVMFDSDPVKNIKVTTPFDSYPSIASFIQCQIEAQMKASIMEDVPEMLHIFSRIKDSDSVHLRVISQPPYRNPVNEYSLMSLVPFKRPTVAKKMKTIYFNQCSLVPIKSTITDSITCCEINFFMHELRNKERGPQQNYRDKLFSQQDNNFQLKFHGYQPDMDIDNKYPPSHDPNDQNYNYNRHPMATFHRPKRRVIKLNGTTLKSSRQSAMQSITTKPNYCRPSYKGMHHFLYHDNNDYDDDDKTLSLSAVSSPRLQAIGTNTAVDESTLINVERTTISVISSPKSMALQ